MFLSGFVCEQHNSKTNGQILMKCLGNVGSGTKKN